MEASGGSGGGAGERGVERGFSVQGRGFRRRLVLWTLGPGPLTPGRGPWTLLCEGRGVDGLIAGSIFGGVGRGFGAVNVGRKREVAYGFERGVKVGGGGEAEGAFAEGAGGKDGGRKDEILRRSERNSRSLHCAALRSR